MQSSTPATGPNLSPSLPTSAVPPQPFRISGRVLPTEIPKLLSSFCSDGERVWPSSRDWCASKLGESKGRGASLGAGTISTANPWSDTIGRPVVSGASNATAGSLGSAMIRGGADAGSDGLSRLPALEDLSLFSASGRLPMPLKRYSMFSPVTISIVAKMMIFTSARRTRSLASLNSSSAVLGINSPLKSCGDENNPIKQL